WIPFTRFGPLIVERILSPEQIRIQLVKIIGEEPIRFEDALAEGSATVRVGEIKREVRPCQAIFDVPLTLDLEFTIVLVGESYSGPAALSLRLVARTFEPAIIYLYARRVTENDVVFEGDIVEGWGLAKRLGPQWKLVDHMVRVKIKEQINSRLYATRRTRVIDLSSLALESATVTADPIPALHRSDPAPVISAGTVLTGVLEPQSSHSYAVALGAGETCKFIVYAGSDRYPLEPSGQVNIQNAKGENLPDARVPLKAEAAWFGEYHLQELEFRAPEVGVYRLRLYNYERRTENRLLYMIRQERGRPERGRAVCFEPFGPLFMQNVISCPVVENRLRKLIPSTRSFGPLSILPLVQAEGDARIAVLSVEPDSPRRGDSDKELAHKVLLRIDPEVCVTLLGIQESWRVQTLVTLRLRLHAFERPLSVQIDPDEVTIRSVRVLDAACIEGPGRFNQLNLLSRSVARPLVEQIKKLLDEVDSGRNIEIRDFLKEAAATRASALPAPAQLLAKSQIADTIEGDTRPGDEPRLWWLQLNRKQKVRVHLRWRLSHRGKRPVNVSLAILDEYRGVLRVSNEPSGSTVRLGSARLSLTVPRSGDYAIRLRVDPSRDKEDIRVDYTLRITVS
ncbi:MAG: hypothetical protein ACM3JD_07150, partial [Rudaea sp.]